MDNNFITCRDMANYSRLGNQMFQYAFMKNISNKLNIPIYLRVLNTDNEFYKTRLIECFKLDDYKELDEKYYDQNVDKIYQCNEKTMEYDQKLINELLENKNKQININGYFQSEKYFDKITFQFKDDIEIKSQEIINLFLEKKYTLISLHIRRGDISNNTAANSPISKKYIVNSIKYMEDNIKSDKMYLIFSDDHEYCKKELPQIISGLNIKCNLITSKSSKFVSEYLDLCIMSKCEHNIISGSSFSWWGAYLNKNDKKIVISPTPWFNINHMDGKRLCSQEKDIIPKEWIRMEN